MMILIFAIHWIADFVLQTRYQANHKSHDIRALLSHTITYSFCWFALWPVLGLNTIYFVGITLVCHTVTDFFTSKLTAFLWKRRELYVGIYRSTTSIHHLKKGSLHEHAFWATIGGDQFLHAAQLILTFNFLS